MKFLSTTIFKNIFANGCFCCFRIYYEYYKHKRKGKFWTSCNHLFQYFLNLLHSRIFQSKKGSWNYNYFLTNWYFWKRERFKDSVKNMLVLRQGFWVADIIKVIKNIKNDICFRMSNTLGKRDMVKHDLKFTSYEFNFTSYKFKSASSRII